MEDIAWASVVEDIGSTFTGDVWGLEDIIDETLY